MWTTSGSLPNDYGPNNRRAACIDSNAIGRYDAKHVMTYNLPGRVGKGGTIATYRYVRNPQIFEKSAKAILPGRAPLLPRLFAIMQIVTSKGAS
jgi:hypothetical protein